MILNKKDLIIAENLLTYKLPEAWKASFHTPPEYSAPVYKKQHMCSEIVTLPAITP